jgi:hypothetical protein
MNTVEKGERTEGAVLGHLVKKGFTVAVPFGGSKRFDLLVEEDSQFLKAQVKTGRVRKDAVVFNCHSVPNGKVRRLYTAAQVDIFLVYAP